MMSSGGSSGLDSSPSASPDATSGGGAGGATRGGGAANDSPAAPSRYEAQKRRDWNTFGQYLKNHRPPLALARCSGAHVLEFLRYLDQFGKTKIHAPACPFFGNPHPPAPCACPLRQAWGSLDALIGRLRAAFEEHGGKPESNPFGTRAVRLYLREVRELQAKARGIAYEKKKRKRPSASASASASASSSSAQAQAQAQQQQQQQQQHHQHHQHQQLQGHQQHLHHQHQQHQQQHQQQQMNIAHHHSLVAATAQQQVPLIQHQQLQHHQQFLPQALQTGASCLQILN